MIDSRYIVCFGGLRATSYPRNYADSKPNVVKEDRLHFGFPELQAIWVESGPGPAIANSRGSVMDDLIRMRDDHRPLPKFPFTVAVIDEEGQAWSVDPMTGQASRIENFDRDAFLAAHVTEDGKNYAAIIHCTPQWTHSGWYCFHQEVKMPTRAARA